MKLDELIKEIQDLKEKERQLEYLKKDKKKMADKLLEYELKEQNTHFIFPKDIVILGDSNE